LADDRGTAAANLQHFAVLKWKDVLGLQSTFHRELSVVHDVPSFAESRYKISRFDDGHNQLQLFAAGMLRNVNSAAGTIYGFDSDRKELIEKHRQLARSAGRRLGTEDNGVAVLEREVSVAAVSKLFENIHGIAFQTGGDDQHLLVRELRKLLQTGLYPPIVSEIASHYSNDRSLDQRLTVKHYLSSALGGEVEEDLKPVRV